MALLTLWTCGSLKTDPQSLITKPQVIEYEGDGRASTTFDFRLYSFQDPRG